MAEQPDRSLEGVPLLDLCNDAHRLCRALVEHLEQAFIPKTVTLGRTVKIADPEQGEEEASDIQVRNRAAEVLDQDQHTQKLERDLTRHLRAMEAQIDEIARQSEI